MTPTAKLRYLAKPVEMTTDDFADLHPTATRHMDGRVRVLQQWWEGPKLPVPYKGYVREGEWRDIPVEGEA